MTKANLVAIPTLVESPFIVATIGGYTFGSFSKNDYSSSGVFTNINFPNYMKSLDIIKVNGTVNTYTLTFSYQVAYGDDPNKLDKIFSRAAKDRKITLSYGDWNSPSYIYKEETGIITNVTSSLNMSNSSIDYTVKCTSDAIGLTSTKFSFPARNAKPSEVLMDMLSNVRYGLKSVFTGMQDMGKVLAGGLIASNDKKTKLSAQKGVTPLEYMSYLVNSMTNTSNTDSTQLSDTKYFLSIHDDVNNQFGGTYFKVSEVGQSSANSLSADTYELDVNFPTDNFITQFSLVNDQSWSILYEYSKDVSQQTYSYKINDDGKMITTYAPSLLRGSNGDISNAESNWWSLMTNFPITANLTMKGLTRPSLLMSYVKLNVWFHGGQKHVSSGLYIITKQQDKIDSSGYKTTLTLLRVGEDT